MNGLEYIRSTGYWKNALSSIEGIAGARECVFSEGSARGMRAIEVYTGSGFEFTVLPERGLDIADAKLFGIPIAYIPKMGVQANAACGAPGSGEFLRNFLGGLVTTCGLDNVGSECTIDGMFYPMHGRHTYTPAHHVTVERFWDKDDYRIVVSGSVRLAALFRENLVLRRRIETALGQSKLVIEDTIVNESGQAQQYMLMYHCNFGFPLVSPDSRMITNHKRAEFLDEQSRQLNIDRHRFATPQSDYKQSAFTLHDPAGQVVKSVVANPKLGLGAYVQCDANQLGSFTQWVQLGHQDYVLGLEPGKSTPIGRKKAIETEAIISIESGAQHQARVEIGVLQDREMLEYERLITEEQK